MAHLPQELIQDILIVSRVKSLLRFRCISKSLNAIIMSKGFIYAHHYTCTEKRIHRKLINNYDIRSRIHALDINDGSVEEFPLGFEIPSISHWDVAYCNGLLLIAPLDFNFSVWNPSTRRYRKLPPFKKNGRIIKVSLGYDAAADVYKVVLFIFKDRTFQGWTFQVWILELRSRTDWRMIQDFPYSKFGHLDLEQNCSVDGCVHFLWRQKIGYEGNTPHSIMAFDIGRETFSMVPLPNYESEGYPLLLQAFEGCLLVGLQTENEVDLYVRKKEGVDFNWTKLFSFATQQIFDPISYVRILGHSKGRDKILLACSTDIMYSYDVKEKTLQEIEMTNTGKWSSILCIESLVSVGS